MRSTRMLFAFLLLSAVAAAQESPWEQMSDSDFIELFRTRNEPPMLPVLVTGDEPLRGAKCSFGLMAEAARRLPLMSPADAQMLKLLVDPPATQTSIVSPSGRFRVYFDTTGRHTPAMIDAAGNRIDGSARIYADSVAAIFDYVYGVEVEQLGYEVPPLVPGHSEYDIYIQEYNGGFYGETAWTGPVVNPGVVKLTYSCFVIMDNDYREYFSKGLAGLRVTSVHEFHHVIQLGRYGSWDSDRWMHEMSSTYYEEFIFPEVNDYLLYVKDFMNFPDRSMYAWGIDGYKLVLWPILLDNHYGPDLMRRFWTGMKQREPVTVMRDELALAGGDFSSDFCTWTETNYFTAWRSDRIDPAEYEDAGIFPAVKLEATQELIGGDAKFSGLVYPLSAHYVRVARGLDSVTFVVSNADITSAIARSAQPVGYELEVRDNAPDDSWHSLTNGWSYKFASVVPNALCLHVLDAGTLPTDKLREPYPNPLLLAETSRIHFPLPRNIPVNRVELSVYSAGMEQIYHKDDVAVQLDDMIGAYVAWDVATGDAEDLASGVYFYVLSYSGEKRMGKFGVVAR